MRPFVLALAAFAVASAPFAAQAAKKKTPATSNTTAAAAAPTAKPAATPAPAAKPVATPAKASAGGAGSKMKSCAATWKAKSKADQDGYTAKGKAMKSKKGNPLTGYQAWTSECMKKA